MAFVTTQRWLRRTAKDAQGKRLAHGVDFSHMALSGGKGAAQIGGVAWDVPFSMELRSAKGKRFDVVETAKGFKVKGCGSDLTFETAETLALPTGEIWTPESGLLKTTLTLDRRPTVNQWVFDLSLPAGTVLAYQPLDLAPEEIAWNAVRPDWAKGSFAVFDATDCKIAHIPRPFARDADGAWTWCTIAYVAGALVVTVPQAFLDAARYPVEIDPTFGYTSIGAAHAALPAHGVALTGTYSPANNGSTDAVSWYLQRANAGEVCTLGIYLNNAGTPTTRIVDTGEVTVSTAAGWNTSNTDSAASIVTTSTYWVAIHTAATSVPQVWYDVTTGPIRWENVTPYVAGAIPNPCPTTAQVNGYQYSAYATYTATSTFVPFPYPLHTLTGGVRE